VAVSNVPILIGAAAWGVLEVDSTKPRDFSLNEEKAANTKLNTIALRKGVNAKASDAA
jgi:putative methionine-R-sulfoxide reductase with GAF domain